MQKNATPCSWVAAYWRKPPIRLPRCFSPVGWMPEKMRIGVLSLTFAAGRLARPAAEIGLAWLAQARQNKVRRWSEDIVLHF